MAAVGELQRSVPTREQNKALTDVGTCASRVTVKVGRGWRPYSSAVLGPFKNKTSYLSVARADQGVIRAARHLHHSLVLQVARDQLRGHDCTAGAIPSLTVAVVAPGIQKSVCSFGQKHSNKFQDQEVGPLHSDEFSTGLKYGRRHQQWVKLGTSPKNLLFLDKRSSEISGVQVKDSNHGQSRETTLNTFFKQNSKLFHSDPNSFASP